MEMWLDNTYMHLHLASIASLNVAFHNSSSNKTFTTLQLIVQLAQVLLWLWNLLADLGHWGVSETSVCHALPACSFSDSTLQMQLAQQSVSTGERIRDGRQCVAQPGLCRNKNNHKLMQQLTRLCSRIISHHLQVSTKPSQGYLTAYVPVGCISRSMQVSSYWTGAAGQQAFSMLEAGRLCVKPTYQTRSCCFWQLDLIVSFGPRLQFLRVKCSN